MLSVPWKMVLNVWLGEKHACLDLTAFFQKIRSFSRRYHDFCSKDSRIPIRPRVNFDENNYEKSEKLKKFLKFRNFAYIVFFS